MLIQKALPVDRFAKAAAHSRSPEFLKKRDEAIARLREWYKHPDINRRHMPCVWFGYGKDGMAVLLLLKMAGIKHFVSLVLRNGGDIAGHELIYPEFDRYFGQFNKVEYITQRRYIEYIYDYLTWGRAYGCKKKGSQELIDFFDWGAMYDSITYETVSRYQFAYGDSEDKIMNIWGERAAEGMERAFAIKNYGLFSLTDGNSKGMMSYYRALPIGDWKDIDVWALLVSENCPVSSVYSMHQLPQKSGRGAFPRTFWYCSPHIFSSTFYKWMAHYIPSQLKEMLDLFPEIQGRLREQPSK